MENVIKPDGKSLINPNKVFKDKDFYKSWKIEEALDNQEYNLKLAKEQIYTKKKQRILYKKQLIMKMIE